MISKARIKYIKSLELKKNRSREKAFVAEGPKVVGDLLMWSNAKLVVATQQWMEANASSIDPQTTELLTVDDEELRKVSFMQHPQQVLAVFDMPDTAIDITTMQSNLVVALDNVQDPGNLGTIIRIADWFGVKTVVCSNDTADVYNPKVVQATMGSLARVNVVYEDLGKLIDRLPDKHPIYGTFLDGSNIYDSELTDVGLIVMGNEGNGISERISSRISRRLFVPPFPADDCSTDSLNVAVATAVVCAEFRRRTRCRNA